MFKIRLIIDKIQFLTFNSPSTSMSLPSDTIEYDLVFLQQYWHKQVQVMPKQHPRIEIMSNVISNYYLLFIEQYSVPWIYFKLSAHKPWPKHPSIDLHGEVNTGIHSGGLLTVPV